jgi:hypothetical protein
MRFSSFLPSSLILFVGTVALADGADPAAARAQLQQGYALKQQGKCDEAIPHFVESAKLDRQPKALVNLADCEEKLGKLASAQAHFVEARDLAKGLESLRTVAEQHLAALEKRMPKLAVKLAKDAPNDTVILRDGIQLGQVSLNTPLPIDPGRHAIVARGANLEKQYTVTLVEGETKELTVTPVGGEPVTPPLTGAAQPSAMTSPAVGTSSPKVEPGPSLNLSEPPSNSSRSTGSVQRTLGFAAIGAGAVGLAVGTVFALKLSRKNDEIEGICPTGTPCGPTDVVRYQTAVEDAKGHRTLSGVGFGVGAAFAVAGGILVLTAPRNREVAWRAPEVRVGWGQIEVGGAW